MELLSNIFDDTIPNNSPHFAGSLLACPKTTVGSRCLILLLIRTFWYNKYAYNLGLWFNTGDVCSIVEGEEFGN